MRVYADTSVFGGCFDPEFEAHSRALFDELRALRHTLVVSPTTLAELSKAPAEVRAVLASIPPEALEAVSRTPEVDALRDAYLSAGIVGPASMLDAEHIAFATVAGADVIVSWNFKHVVHFEKIRGYQGVNLMKGYHLIAIHTPREVVGT